jgi:uncharacterized BrkB/YihY/UPF0761 family membrane protein
MGLHDAAATVEDATTQTGNEWWWLLPLALYFLYFATSALLKMLRLMHLVVWDQLEGRVKIAPREVAWMFVAIVAVVFIAAFASLVRERSDGLGIAAAMVVMLVYFAFWLIVSYLLPHREVPWTSLVPGAVLFAVGVQIVYLLTIFWISGKIESASALYGALGIAAAILLWLYLLGRVVVASAVLNVTVWERKHGAPAPDTPASPSA